jgi:CRP/FNR family transcriptional regulator
MSLEEKLKDFFAVQFEKELLNEIVKVGEIKFYREGDILMDIGDNVDFIPFLLRGVFKVVREDEKENEIAIYFLERGDTCASTFVNFLHTAKSPVRAVAETDCEVILVKTHYFDKWMSEYKSFRDYVIESYNIRLNELLEAIDSMVFMKMNERLMKYLQDKVQVLRNPSLKTTHQQIAFDLNTSRVVISRLLKQLENEGKIRIGRNKIDVLSL